MEALFPLTLNQLHRSAKRTPRERNDRGFVRSVHCFREYHRLPFSLSKHAPQVIHFAPFTSMPGITMKRKEPFRVTSLRRCEQYAASSIPAGNDAQPCVFRGNWKQTFPNGKQFHSLSNPGRLCYVAIHSQIRQGPRSAGR
jgi:hypothetical protein